MLSKTCLTSSPFSQRLYAAHQLSFSVFKSVIFRKGLNKPSESFAYFSRASKTSSKEMPVVVSMSLSKLSSSTSSYNLALSTSRAPLVRTTRSSTYNLHQWVLN
eukprot:Pompholyxophrys_sp_v1_NODE_79_length_2277_cov_110.450945.p3 type:complete len:104 gc:universal NODE_79_length_2277_cov_110.450945:432-121(-)